MIDSVFLKEKLSQSQYDPALGVRVVHLSETTVGEVKTELIVVQMDAGKGLRPHLHEKNGEIGIPLTKGFVRFGHPVTDEVGEYVWEKDEVKVEWDEEREVEPGKSFEIPCGVAHHFRANSSEEFLIFFLLPSNHLGEDRKFVTAPKIES